MGSVSVRDLEVAFGGHKVLQHLHIDVKEGEFVVLLGPSGCGKSTLLNAIAGLLEVSGGQIWIDGRNVTWEEPKDRGIGMVFQSYALYPRMTVERNLSFGLRVSGIPVEMKDAEGKPVLDETGRPRIRRQRVPREEIKRRVERAANILQIMPFLARRPSELSGGQRQRVAIGRALVRDVDVFLFDEPLSNLDAKLRTELRVELKRLHRELGSTMIFVTHDQIEALTLADRIAVMHSGVIQQFASPKEIYRRPVNRFVAGFVGSPSMNFFKGRLVADGGSPAIVLGDGSRVGLAGYAFAATPGGDRPTVLGVRPEQLDFRSSGGPSSIPFTTSIVEPMGSDSLVWGTVAGDPASVRVEPDFAPSTGETAPLHFDPQIASLFDEATGARL